MEVLNQVNDPEEATGKFKSSNRADDVLLDYEDIQLITEREIYTDIMEGDISTNNDK